MSLKPPTAGNSPILRTNVLNAQDYGLAAASSATINTAALNAALVAGTQVFVPQGTYSINGEILIPSDTTLYSEGTGAVLSLPSSLAGTSVVGIRNTDQVSGNSRCHVRNIRLVGPETAVRVGANVDPSPRGVYFNRVTDGSITGCHISRFNLQGIQADVCTRLKITGNSVIEIKSGNGISVDATSIDCSVTGNSVQGVADCGIGTHNASARTIIANNTITTTDFGRGIDVHGAPDTLIIGNTIRGATGKGIQIREGLSSNAPHRCAVIGNTIVGGAASGIVVDGTIATNDTLISGNQIQGVGDKGVYISQLVARILVSGNQINGSAGAGVYVEHSGGNIPTRVHIAGNQITGNGTYGIHATSSVASIKQEANDLVGNAIQACNMPIPTVASTGALGLPTHSGFVNVSGTTNITSIAVGGLGDLVTLQFSGILTVTDGSNLKLEGNFVTTADDTLTLRCDGGANWYEVGRAVI